MGDLHGPDLVVEEGRRDDVRGGSRGGLERRSKGCEKAKSRVVDVGVEGGNVRPAAEGEDLSGRIDREQAQAEAEAEHLFSICFYNFYNLFQNYKIK
jgi:hypothetical protein